MSLKHPFPTRGGTYRWDGKNLVEETTDASAPQTKPTTVAPSTDASVSLFRRGKKSTDDTATED